MRESGPRFLPLMHDAAEYLVMGHLLRRNVLTYKAPTGFEGYDLIRIHPDPKHKTKVVKVQVKSRCQTDCDRSVFVRQQTFPAFDYLVIVLLNIGWYYDDSCKNAKEGRQDLEFYTLPRAVARRLYFSVKSEMNRVRTAGRNLERYRGDQGFELIAEELGVDYPSP